MERVGEGLTTMEEVERVVPFARIADVTCAACDRELSGAVVFCPFCGSQRPGLEPLKPLGKRSMGFQLVNS